MAKRTDRAKRAAMIARSTTATKEQKQAARNIIKAEKAAVALGSDIDALREARTGEMDVRAERFRTGGTQSLADTIAAANRARAFADAMRRITEREKGEGTPYTGPGISVDDGSTIIDPDAYSTRFMLPETTKWQDENIAWMLEQEGDNVPDQRVAFRTNEAGDTWDPTTGKWVRGDRAAFVKEQLRRYNLGEAPKPKFKSLLDGDGDGNDDGDGDGGRGGRGGRGWQVGGPGGPAGETDYLAYRPGSEAYWRSYMGPKLTGSLMRMKQPAVTQASLGYLPGEVRSPASKQMWSQFLGMGGLGTKGRSPDKQFQGAIPQGTWRTNIASYPGLGASGIRQPGWQFAAAPSQMIAQPAWTAYDISPQAAGEWTGLLGDWAAPALNTTNLLGVA